MGELDTAAWYALGFPLYLAFVAVEMWMLRRRGQPFGFAETISNLSAGLGTLIIGLFAGPWVLRGWDFIHERVAPFPWPAHGLWKLPVALVLADFCYYVYHRAGHRFALFWSIHGIHHQHEHLSSTVGFRLEWLADPYAALFFGLMPLLGCDSTTGFLALAALSLYALTAHAPLLARPSLGIFVTPAIHGSHHSRDARFAEANYGAMLGVWDRLFGTWREPPRGTVLGTDVPSICRTHDGVTTQFGLVAELYRQVARTPTLRARLALLFGRPVLAGPGRPLRPDAAIPTATRVYVVVSFLFLTALATWLLWFRDTRPLPVQLIGGVAIVLGLHTLGALLDDRPGAEARERMRLAATVVLGAALWFHEPVAGVVVAFLAGAALPLRAALLPREAPG